MFPSLESLTQYLPLGVQTPQVQISTLKRFEFSAARRRADGRWYGHNFSGWVAVRGPLDERSGMIINITTLKEITQRVLLDFDHRFLNTLWEGDEPSTVQIAQALFNRIQALLPPPVAMDHLELSEEGGLSAQVEADSSTEIVSAVFAAAHRTYAPRLSEAQNQALFGRCSSAAGHGHNYRVEIALPRAADFPYAWVAALDHRNLNGDIPDLAGHNVTSETLARFFAQHTPGARWVRLWEMPDFFAEYLPQSDRYRLGREYRFFAAHRLVSPYLSADQNRALYGKCNRPHPHGHTYRLQVIVEGDLDPLTETVFDLGQLDRLAQEVIQPLNHTYLDEEVPAFRLQPSTGENLAAYLFNQFEARLSESLHSVKVWETPNNLFIARHRSQ